MELWQIDINISGEVATYYRWAYSFRTARSYAIRKAMRHYGMSRSRIMSFNWEVKKVKVEEKDLWKKRRNTYITKNHKKYGIKQESCGTCRCGLEVWNDDCYQEKGKFECSECHNSR